MFDLMRGATQEFEERIRLLTLAYQAELEKAYTEHYHKLRTAYTGSAPAAPPNPRKSSSAKAAGGDPPTPLPTAAVLPTRQLNEDK